jgi:hypothetical protein
MVAPSSRLAATSPPKLSNATAHVAGPYWTPAAMAALMRFANASNRAAVPGVIVPTA